MAWVVWISRKVGFLRLPSEAVDQLHEAGDVLFSAGLLERCVNSNGLVPLEVRDGESLKTLARADQSIQILRRNRGETLECGSLFGSHWCSLVPRLEDHQAKTL